jgi:hypothetical protein
MSDECKLRFKDRYGACFIEDLVIHCNKRLNYTVSSFEMDSNNEANEWWQY